MREGWAVRPLEEVADACLGKMLDKNKNRGEAKPYLRNLNVRWFEFDLSDMLEMRFEEGERERYTARKGDLLICEGGYPGRAAIWPYDEPIYFQKALHRVRFQEPERAKWFLYYLYLCDLNGSLHDYFTGAGIQHFTGEALKRFRIPLPPLPEQQRIVAILDGAFAGLATAAANAKKNLQNSSELFDGYLESIFSRKGQGWVDRVVGEVADCCLGKMLDKSKNRGELKPYLRNLNVRWFEFDLSDILEMRFEEDEKDRYSAIKGDLLICEGGYPGRGAIWQDEQPIYFQKAIHRVRFRTPYLNKWFLYFLYLMDAKGELRRHFTGAGIQHFTGQALSKFKFPNPPAAEVREHVAIFDELAEQTSALKKIYETKLGQLRDIRQSILKKAFSGELTSPPSQAIKEAAE